MTDKQRDALTLMLESIHKPDAKLCGCAHNQECYEELNCFEEALKHFGTRVEILTAMEMAKKISPEDAY